MTRNYKLFLVGRTSNGKSSTGNSILSSKPFSLNSEEIVVKSGKANQYDVTLVDGYGIGDSVKDLKGDMKRLIYNIEKVFNENLNNCFSALLLVIPLYVRYTHQESESVRVVKSIFGQNVFEKCGIIVMTYGDMFPPPTRCTSFDTWCKEQKGDIRKLLSECNNRYVLFDNKTCDKNIQKVQVDKLMTEVIKINQEYNDRDFENASTQRNALKGLDADNNSQSSEDVRRPLFEPGSYGDGSVLI
ncbi:uncharacterized protein LOC131938132 [Physella acuta]|uniref:uncharacterized protein LOC131938132 n=1 Tax=Physella acuta TaxID=109671 RepID=UPI0027DB12BD|nr:uncharacterized protein LOC131938132 [Physella acuta]